MKLAGYRDMDDGVSFSNRIMEGLPTILPELSCPLWTHEGENQDWHMYGLRPRRTSLAKSGNHVLICFFMSSFHPISSLTVIKFWAIG